MSSPIYQKDAVLVRSLATTTLADPTYFLLIESPSASERISVGDFVNSYSTVYYQFALSGGNLFESIFSAGFPLSSNNLGRVAYQWQGAYNVSYPYVAYDVVYYNGSSFISLTANTGVIPVSGTGHWDLLALGYVAGTVILTAQTIAALRGLDSITSPQLVVNGTTCEVLGYYTPGDRGGGLFVWNSASTLPDDGGYIIKPSAISGAGRWIRNISGERPNVKMWGAKGDNSTNDTTAITLALSAMRYGWVTELVFTTGSYLINQTLQVPSNIKITGEGPANNTSIGMIQFSNQDIITTISPTTAAPFNYIPTDSGFIIENLTLYFQNYNNPIVANTSNTALTIHNPSDGAIIRNITTYGGAYGIKCIGTTSNGLKIEDISTNYSYNAGVIVQPLSSVFLEVGTIDIDGLYAFNSDTSSYGSAIIINNEASNISLKNISLSGSFGAGAILWNVPQLSGLQASPYLKISNSVFKGDNVYSTNFLTLSTTQTTSKIPVVCFEGLTLSNCNNIIQDSITNNSIPFYNLSSFQPSVPFYYSINNIGANPRDTIITSKKIDTYTAQFLPVSAGWYSIFTAQSGQAVANISIASVYESTNFDVVFNNSNNNTGYFKINRYDTLNSVSVPRARVLSYNNNVYIDVYVQNPGIPLTFTYKDDGRENYKKDGLCILSPASDTPDQNFYSGYEEIVFDRGLITSSSSINNGHLKMGDNHFWVENGTELRHYNDGLDVLFVSTLSAPTIIGLYNTGVNNDNSLATLGTLDQHWNIITSNTTYSAPLSTAVLYTSSWSSNGAASNWITPCYVQNYNSSTHPQTFPNTATFTYSLSFTIPSNANLVQSLQGGIVSDDNITSIAINNTSIGFTQSSTYNNQPSLHPFTFNTTGLLVNGINQIEIITNNSGGSVTGLRVEFYNSTSGKLSLGSGAQARAYTQNGSVVRVNVLNGGSNFTATPSAFAISYDGGGSGAILVPSIANGQITSISILSGGIGYNTAPFIKSGRKILSDDEPLFSNQYNLNRGVAIRNVRYLSYKNIFLSIAQGSIIATGTGLLSSVYAGDRIWGQNGNVYEFQQVIDDKTAILNTPYSNSVPLTNAAFTLVGWEIFPVNAKYKYSITGIHLPGATWSPTSHFALRTKNYNSLTDSVISSATPAAGMANDLLSTSLSANFGVSLDFTNTSNTAYMLPTAGTPVLVEVVGMRYPANSTY